MRQANHQAILSPCLEQSGKIGGRAKRAGVKTINNEKWRINNSGNHRQLQPYAADARGASLRTGNIETRNFNALSFCDANIPNSSLLIPNFLDMARRVPTAVVGGQCVKSWGQFAVDTDTLWTLQLYKLYKLFRLYSLLFTPYSLLIFGRFNF